MKAVPQVDSEWNYETAVIQYVTCWRMTVRLGRGCGGTRDTCPMKHYESIVLVLLLCILVVVTIVNIMDYLAI